MFGRRRVQRDRDAFEPSSLRAMRSKVMLGVTTGLEGLTLEDGLACGRLHGILRVSFEEVTEEPAMRNSGQPA